MAIIVHDTLIGPATPVELTQWTGSTGPWAYARTAPNGSGIQVGPNGAWSNASAISQTNGGVAYRSDHSLPGDAWVQATMAGVVNIGGGMAIILRANAQGTWFAMSFYGNGQSNLFISTAGATPVAPVGTPSSATGLTYTAGDIIRLELQTVAGATVIRCLRATAAAPTIFQTLWTPGAVNVPGTTFLTTTAAGGYSGIAAFIGMGSLTYVTNFSSGDFATGPVVPSASKGAFTIRTTSQT